MSVIETAKRKMDEVNRAIAYKLPGYSKSDMAWWCAYIEGAEDQKREDEPKHGEWIKGIHAVECSVCSHKFYFDEEIWVEDYDICEDMDWKHCPWCGAKMEEAKDGK